MNIQRLVICGATNTDIPGIIGLLSLGTEVTISNQNVRGGTFIVSVVNPSFAEVEAINDLINDGGVLGG